MDELETKPAGVEDYRSLISRELTQEEAFIVQQFVLDFNVRFTSQRCGCSKDMVRRTIKKPEAEVSIDNLKAKIAEKCDLSAAQILNELKRIALYDSKDHVKKITEHGIEFKPLDEIDGRAIGEITTQSTAEGFMFTTMKAHPKMKALEVLANWYKGQDTEKHLHVHVDAQNLGGKTAQESANIYNQMLMQ